MAKVLQNFLIGVGLDTENYDKGAKGVEGSLSRMRTLVGFTGAAMVGAFAMAGTAAINAGNRVDKSMLAWEKFKTPPTWINSYGNAIAIMGGNFEDAAAAIDSIETAQTDLKLKGLLGKLEDVAIARGDINALMDLPSGAEFLRTLAPMVQNMNKDQQRLVQQTLGLSDGVMRSLRGGVGELDAAIARAGELYGNFGRATEAAREYNQALSEIKTQFDGIGETLAEKMLPAFNDILKSTSGFIEANRGAIDKTIDTVAENPVATASIATLAAPAAWAIAKGVGIRGLGVAGLAYGAYEGLKDEPVGDWWNQSVDSARDSWRNVTGQNDYSHLPDAPYGPAVPNVAPGSIIPRDPNKSYFPIDQRNMQAPVSTEPIDVMRGDWLPLNQGNYHDGYKPEPIVESPTSGLITPYESIYGGGEVSNAEAAQASPEVIMVQGQRQQADKPLMPQRVTVQNHLEANLTLDGRALETKITDVVERRERDATEDIASSVDR